MTSWEGEKTAGRLGLLHGKGQWVIQEAEKAPQMNEAVSRCIGVDCIYDPRVVV